MAPRAAIVGCAGTALTPEERALFAETDPAGFILFRRNCEHPEQVRALVDALRDSVGRADAPVLIDQEGGRVARLTQPHWTVPPAAARFGALAAFDPAAARRAAWLNGRVIGADLIGLGITVNTLPVLDCPAPDADPVIGDRAFAREPEVVTALGRATAAGLLAAGVAPVMKHIPGHGRARVDSHHALPRIPADLAALAAADFEPFRRLNELPWAMTAHAVFDAVDPERPTTTSAAAIGGAIRERIGFDGVLVSDDLGMAALAGDLGARAGAALAAGCDLVLHCSGHPDEVRQVLAACDGISGRTQTRLHAAESHRRAQADRGAFDIEAARRELDALLTTM
ncbi:beta-N-acetylhexosaminidase [Limimonas halophila]|uniref:beta-N-acetylhexosaminidase n=1 Tax=Limimonas halophila TaxID=1082479 RepID=A0A1G7NGJ2_9PROT|nr:beta-N-acetylhexosaminidase [Limimonas halophila]SDF73086.1 beta-N-acetylhexosaminidase [Limimonas halophila]